MVAHMVRKKGRRRGTNQVLLKEGSSTVQSFVLWVGLSAGQSGMKMGIVMAPSLVA